MNIGKRRKFDFDKLIARFRERGVSEKCPCCENAQWQVNGGNTGQVTCLPWGTGSETIFTQGIDVISLACTNCGFVRMHDIDFLGEDLMTEEEI